jgi:hypothetical protein
MRLLRSVAAVAAGYGVMSLTVIGGIIIAASLFVPGGLQAVAGGARPTALPAAYLALNLATGALGAVLGGWLAARIAAFAPFGHAAVLAAMVATLTGVTAASVPAGPQPGWYPIAIGVIGVGGVLAGGTLRAAAGKGTRDSVDVESAT